MATLHTSLPVARPTHLEDLSNTFALPADPFRTEKTAFPPLNDDFLELDDDLESISDYGTVIPGTLELDTVRAVSPALPYSTISFAGRRSTYDSDRIPSGW